MAKATQQVFAEDMSEEKVDFCLEIATDAFNQAIWRCEGEPPECDRDGMPISVETEDK